LFRFCIVLALGALVTVGAFGVLVGIKVKTYQLLFELKEREAMIAAIKQVLGLQRTLCRKATGSLDRLSVLPGKRDGYYVDVGSGDGVFVSNTKLLDDMGWKGVVSIRFHEYVQPDVPNVPPACFQREWEESVLPRRRSVWRHRGDVGRNLQGPCRTAISGSRFFLLPHWMKSSKGRTPQGTSTS